MGRWRGRMGFERGRKGASDENLTLGSRPQWRLRAFEMGKRTFAPSERRGDARPPRRATLSMGKSPENVGSDGEGGAERFERGFGVAGGERLHADRAAIAHPLERPGDAAKVDPPSSGLHPTGRISNLHL